MKIISLLILSAAINLNAQVWKIIDGAEMPFPVFGGEAVVIDSMIYILGGFSDSLNTNINVIQEYNPQNNSWRIADSLNASRYGFVAGNFQDSIVAAGGIDSALSLGSSLEIWNLNEPPYIFDLRTDFIRIYPAGLIRDSIFYVFGGISVNLLSTYMFEYNIPDSTFSFRNNFEFTAAYPFQQMAAHAGNSIYLIGGIFIGTSRAVYRYDIENKTLDLLQSELSQSRAGGKAVSVNDSLIYVIGGFNETLPALASSEIFKIENGFHSINNGPPLNFERAELMAVKFGNSIFVFGGKDEDGDPVSQVEKLELITNVENENFSGPGEYFLYPNYPNPFNPSTSINFYLPAKSFVQIKIYNISGEEIFALVGEDMNEGNHNILFNASEEKLSLASGIYFYRLIAFNNSGQKTYIATRKMLLLK